MSDDNRIDPESYDGVKQTISNLPITWLPGLLRHVVQCCVTKNVFHSREAIVDFVDHVTRAAKKGGTGGR